MTKEHKELYVGKVFIVNIENGEVLVEGTGAFSRKDKKLDIHYETSSLDAIEGIRWLPVLSTEDGYFSPAQTRDSTIVTFPFQSSSRNTFSMDSYFNWSSEKGLDHLFDSFEAVYIDVKSVPQSKLATRKDNSTTLTVEANSQLLEEVESNGIKISAKLIYSTKGYSISPAVRFKIQLDHKPINDWLKIVHSYRLYWILNNDHINSEALNICFGENLQLTTGLTTFSGYTDNTHPIDDALKSDTKLNIDLFVQCMVFFANDKEKKIMQSLFSFMAVRLSQDPKNIVDDPLRIVFSIDGFTSTYLKSKKKSKALKTEQKDSIDKILGFVESNKNSLEKDVFKFYAKSIDQIYSSLSQRPFTESVKVCFEKLGLEYPEYEDTIESLNEVRQTFVHGKDYNTQEIAKALFTHSTHDIKRSDEGSVTQISFGQKSGLVDDGYKMLRELYLAYMKKASRK